MCSHKWYPFFIDTLSAGQLTNELRAFDVRNNYIVQLTWQRNYHNLKKERLPVVALSLLAIHLRDKREGWNPYIFNVTAKLIIYLEREWLLVRGIPLLTTLIPICYIGWKEFCFYLFVFNCFSSEHMCNV